MAAGSLVPIAFTARELDTLLLGLAMLDALEDEELGGRVDAARARIAAVLPPEPAYRPRRDDPPLVRAIRGAIAAEERLALSYTDGKGRATERVVWPIAFDDEDMLAAWCETRRDFRHFRLDRMDAAERTGERYPTRRRLLQAAWLRQAMEQDRW